MDRNEYIRMLDKTHVPTKQEIDAHLGVESRQRLDTFEGLLTSHYKLTKELRFPFGNSYGWGYKYSHKAKHLCYLFFEKEAFTVLIQIGDKMVAALENKLCFLLPKTNDLWENRYTCGERGGWVHYRVLTETELQDVYELIKIKCKPINE